tara:strand:+ start:290 stop:571 length:282 start_codon:yes stop_codon:yes gene_type:complete
VYRSTRNKKRKTKVWAKIRKPAPKVPDLTCPAVDELQQLIAHLYDNNLKVTKTRCKGMQRKLEKLRSANEALRDSGIYWHDAAKDLCKKYIDK